MNALDTPNKTLFLSYSRKQTAWCDDLHTAIDTYTHFQRWRDNKIPESADWWDSICLNIEGCFAFVAILTQDYLDSAYCMGELDYALKLKKPVIALMLKDVAYPPALNEQRLQFTRVDKLAMPEVMNKVLNACNEITLGYVRGSYSADIHPRPHLRPPVPTPKANAKTPEEDRILSEQIESVSVHGQIPTRDILHRFNEEKTNNIRLARDLLNRLMERQDLPVFFDLQEEDEQLRAAEERLAEEERQRQRLKRIREDYDDLVRYVANANVTTARKAIKRFTDAYPDFGDPQGVKARFFPTSLALMPKPFDWIAIHGGRGTMKTDESDVTLTIPTENYWISKYPITNAQFAQFVEAGGYNQPKWWTEAGWEAKKKGRAWDNNKSDWVETNKAWTEPRYWQDAEWNGVEQPVVGVSWYEAVAFCLWLTDVTGETIMLPTEAQWQYAAQGDDGRAYPWENQWDATRCNSDESGIGKTTPVTQFEGKHRGDSPFGVVDMAGNVWEWCLTDYDSKTNNVSSNANRRVLRGGSFLNTTDLLRSALRLRSDPVLVSIKFGFRCVRS